MNMIKINRTKKSKLSIFGAAVLAVMLLASCSNMFQTKKEKSFTDSQLPDSEMGIITVKVNDGNARTILPSTDDFKVENLTNIKLEGSWQGGDTQTVIEECTNWTNFQANATTAVQTGNWIFTLTAKLGNVTFTGTQGTSTSPVTIVKNTNTTLSFTLETTTTYGGLSLGITMISGDATTIDATLKTARTGGTVVDEQSLSITGSTTTYAISIDGTTSNNEKLTAGTYYLELAFKANDTLPVLNTWKGIVRIEKGITTTSSITWSTDEVYEIQLTDNGGVLSGGGSVTPISFTRKSSEITLPQMTKAGYYFEGWYKDSVFTANKKITKIPAGTTGDQPVYARYITELYVEKSTTDGGQGLDTNDGTRANAPLASIDAAVAKIIDFATSGIEWTIHVNDEIKKDGSQTVPAELTSSHASKLTIQGTTGTDTDILNGNQSVTTLKILTAVPVTVSNLKITGGSDLTVNDADETSGKGGGLYVSGASTVTLSGVEISDNDAAYGGGIYAAAGSSVEIEDTLIDQNEAHPETTNWKTGSGCGGGIYLAEGVSLSLGEKTIISNNKAFLSTDYRLILSTGMGGGIYSSEPTSFTIVEAVQNDDAVKILSNNAQKTGGGIYYSSGSVELDIPAKTVFIENSCDSGGGAVYVGYQTVVTLENGVIIEKNSASQGGGIYNYGILNLKGGTIGGTTEDTSNTADQGGAIYNYCSTSASVPSGVINIKSNSVSIPCNEVKKNDVFIPTTNKAESAPLTIATSLSENGAIAYLTVQNWQRGAAILNAIEGHSITSAETQKFILTSASSGLQMNELFDKYIIQGEEGNVDQVKIDASIYVSATGNDGNEENIRYGTINDPFATFGKAIPAAAPGMAAEIVVDGEILLDNGSDGYAVNISYSTGLEPASLLIRGKTGNSTDIINRNLTDDLPMANRYQHKGVCVLVATSAPVTFKNIKITGGNNSEDGTTTGNSSTYQPFSCGGMSVGLNANVTLDEGTLITGNKTAWCGGGVYVNGTYNSTTGVTSMGVLTIKEGAEISGNTALYGYSGSTDSWESGGGGIFNKGRVIMEGGTISSNSAYYVGGGVYNRSIFEMSGGEISGNTLNSSNGSINGVLNYFTSSIMPECKFCIKGSASIPKQATSPQNAIYLRQGAVIQLDGSLDNSDFLFAGSLFNYNNNDKQKVIINAAGMTKSEFQTEVSKISKSTGTSGTLAVVEDEDGIYACIQ